MNRIEISMHQKAGTVELASLLAVVIPGEWTWHLLDFHGIGIAPQNMTMPQFEDLVRTSGYEMTWPELRKSAANLEQTWDCLVVALNPNDKRSRQALLNSDLSDTHLVIEAVDSGKWIVRSNDAACLQPVAKAFSSDAGSS